MTLAVKAVLSIYKQTDFVIFCGVVMIILAITEFSSVKMAYLSWKNNFQWHHLTENLHVWLFSGIDVFDCMSKLKLFINLVKPLEGMHRSFIWTLGQTTEVYSMFNPSLWSLGSSWWHLHLKKSSSLLKFNRPMMINLTFKGSLYSARPLKTALKLYSCVEFGRPFDLMTFLLNWWHCRGCVG